MGNLTYLAGSGKVKRTVGTVSRFTEIKEDRRGGRDRSAADVGLSPASRSFTLVTLYLSIEFRTHSVLHPALLFFKLIFILKNILP